MFLRHFQAFTFVSSCVVFGFYAGNIYVGSFSQQQSNFDHLCYPFDDKTVKFDISIQAPGNYIFDLALLCPEPLLAENHTYGYGGEEIVTKCTYPAVGMSLGFDWGRFICEAREHAERVLLESCPT